MKKLLIATMVLMVAGSTAVFAADDTTYTGKFINKYTQKVTDTEKQLQEKQKANEEAIKKQREENAKKQAEYKKQLEAKQKANQEAAAARQKKWQEKKDAWNKLISE